MFIQVPPCAQTPSGSFIRSLDSGDNSKSPSPERNHNSFRFTLKIDEGGGCPRNTSLPRTAALRMFQSQITICALLSTSAKEFRIWGMLGHLNIPDLSQSTYIHCV